MVIQLKVYDPRGEVKIIDVCETEEELKKMTVQQLKEMIKKDLHINGDIRLVFRTETLEEYSLLVSHGIRHISTIHTVLKVMGGV